MSEAGKGDTPRPVNGDLYREHYDRIFRRKTPEEERERQSCMDRFHDECRKVGFDPYQER